MKLPKLKLPRIAAPAALGKLFKRKGGGEDDDDYDEFGDAFEDDDSPKTQVIDEDNVALEGGEEDDEIPEFEDDDSEFDDEEEGEGESVFARKPVVFAAAGAAVLVLGMLGGGAYWYFSDDSGEAEMQAGAPERKGPRVEMALPAALEPGPVLTPPGAEPQPAILSTQPLRNLTQGSGSLNTFVQETQETTDGLTVLSSSSVAYRTPDMPSTAPLGNVPDALLVEPLEDGKHFLPRIGPEGRLPWQVYSRPNDASDSTPRLGILVSEVGLSRAASMAAVRKLPPEVSLVFDPYGSDLEDWLLRARLAGHEVFMGLPMESDRFPVRDAGPISLTATAEDTENLARLNSVLSLMTGYVGVVSVMGSRFGSIESKMKPVLEVLKARGLMFVDGGVSRSSVGPRIAAQLELPKAIVNMVIDENPSKSAIDAKLAELEQLVLKRRVAVAIARPYPSTIERLSAWLATLQAKQVALVPVSGMADTQKVR